MKFGKEILRKAIRWWRSNENECNIWKMWKMMKKMGQTMTAVKETRKKIKKK